MENRNNITKFPNMEHEFSVMNVRYDSSEFIDYEEAFSGFDKLEVITFSYDLGFIQELSSRFKEIKIILGCEALVKDDAFAMVLESEKYIIEQFSHYKKLRDRVRDGSVTFMILHRSISHEKLYMMSNYDNDHTRVISGSANFTRRGFSGPGVQREVFIKMEDDKEGFDYFHDEIEVLEMECADIVPEDTLISSENGTLADDEVPVAKKIVAKNVNLLLREKENDWNETAFLVNIEAKAQEAKKYYSKASSRTKRVEITPETVRIAVRKRKEDSRKHQEKARSYSALFVDYDSGRVLFNGKPYDMENVDLEKVKSDLRIMGRYFEGYNGFCFTSPHTAAEMKRTYYKLMNFMLLSPFIAKLKAVGHFSNMPETLFPYYALIRGTSHEGKTMFVETIQRLMTGHKIPVLPKNSFTAKEIPGLLEAIKGMPMCFNDLTGDQFKYADNFVKGDEMFCSDEYIHHGTFIITSNSIGDPKKEISKRMFPLTVSGSVPTGSDSQKLEQAVKASLVNLSTEFYTEYLRFMLPEVEDIIFRMQTRAPEDEWIPDIFKVSSEIIIKIYEECNLDVPDYAAELNYDDYFGIENTCVRSKEIIANAWENYKEDVFEVCKAQNVLKYTVGEYSDSARKFMRILPETLCAKQVGCEILMRLDKAKEFFGIDFIDAKEVVMDAWTYDRDAFGIKKAKNMLLLEYMAGDDPDRARELIHIMPKILCARQDGCKVIMDLNKAEEFFGIDFRKRRFGR